MTYENFSSLIVTLCKCCQRNESTYTHFVENGHKLDSFDAVFEAVKRANKGADYKIHTGYAEALKDLIIEEMERDSDYQNIDTENLEHGFTDTFEGAFTRLNEMKKMDFQSVILRTLWSCIYDSAIKSLCV